MGETTQIEWTDATWNPVTGCTKVSEACRHCYIDRTPALFFSKRKFDGPDIGATTGVMLHPERLHPLKWRKPRRIFVCSLADLFHEDVPTEFIVRVFAVMAATPQHTYQVLTKRPARMRALMLEDEFGIAVDNATGEFTHGGLPDWPLPNVWLGVTAESQAWADNRVSMLLHIPAARRFVSVEPMLGSVDLTALRPRPSAAFTVDALRGLEVAPGGSKRLAPRLDWVIAGGESGPGSRPSHPQWFRDLQIQCSATEVAFFGKQWGDWAPAPAGADPGGKGRFLLMQRDGTTHSGADLVRAFANGGLPGTTTRPVLMQRLGKKKAGREMYPGRTFDEIPPAVAL